MTKKEAYKIRKAFFSNDNPTSDDEFIFIEACNFLIETEHDADVMVSLGGYYYDKQKYDLAEKYYLMADEAGNKWVADGLGYIYYYGRTGERDYAKAFHYFSIAADRGDKEAAMKIADMYHNGYGVEKDDEKYKALLLDIYEKVKDDLDLFCPLPEVSHRLAEIFINEGHGEDAIPMLLKAKNYITQRIYYSAFWGNFIVCRRIIYFLYKLVPFNEEEFDFFDLYHVLYSPSKVRLTYNGKTYMIESFFDEGELRVKCQEEYYKSIEDFLRRALFDGKHTYIIDYDDYYLLEVIK